MVGEALPTFLESSHQAVSVSKRAFIGSPHPRPIKSVLLLRLDFLSSQLPVVQTSIRKEEKTLRGLASMSR